MLSAVKLAGVTSVQETRPVWQILASESCSFSNNRAEMRGHGIMLRKRFSSLATKPCWVRPGAHDYLRDVIESRVYDVAIQTPLMHAPSLSKGLPNGCSLFLKREDMQPTFSFNIRGAHNKIAHLTPHQRTNGIVACAAGNHLQGVAYSATKLGVDAIIVAPLGTTNKLPLHQRSHVRVVEHGFDFNDSLKEAYRIAQTEGRSLVHPFDDPLVVAGNGTIGMEILKETAGSWPDAIFVPVGGGGLIAGIAAFVKEVAPSVSIIGVEPCGANFLQESLQSGERVAFASVNRFTDEVGVRAVGEENYRLCKDMVDDVVTVTTDEICSAIKDVFGDTRSLMEPIGAISVAGAKKYAHQRNAQQEKYVAILAAANMDFDRLRFVSERSDDRERFMSVTIPEVKGNFQRLYNLIYPRNVTEFTYRLSSEGDKVAHICMSIQTKTVDEFQDVIHTINDQDGMHATDLSTNELAKAHLRHLTGGRAHDVPHERLFRLEFPERPGALKDFLDSLGQSSNAQWNISLFHYRNHGADIGRVLVAFQVPPSEDAAFLAFLRQLGFRFVDETHNGKAVAEAPKLQRAAASKRRLPDPMPNRTPRAGGVAPLVTTPPSAEEQRLLTVLEKAPDARFPKLLACIEDWQFENQANLSNWRRVLERIETKIWQRARRECPQLVLVHSTATGATAATKTEKSVQQDEEEEKTEQKEPTASSEQLEVECTTQVFDSLRFVAMLLENSQQKHVFHGVEHVVEFLGAKNDRIVAEATRVIAMLSLPPQSHRLAVEPPNPVDTEAHGSSTLRLRLLDIVQARGTANSSLDIVDYLVTPIGAARSDQHVYQFYAESSDEVEEGMSSNAQLITVVIPAVGEQDAPAAPDNERSLVSPDAYASARVCEKLIAQYNVPLKHHFPLYMKSRLCHAAVHRASREASVVERLHSLMALFYTFSDAWDVAHYVEQNPELTRGIVELIRVEVIDKIPLRVRVAALQVLTALVYDRFGRGGSVGVLGRHSNVLSALGVAKGAPHGVLPSLVRFCMSELGTTTKPGRSGSGSNSSVAGGELADSDMDMSLAVAFVRATTDRLTPEEAEIVGASKFRDISTPLDARLTWIEAVLGLLYVVVSMQSGAAVLTENGVIPALLHAISAPSLNALHSAVITQCVQALETTVSNHSAAAALYRDLNGVGIVLDRLMLECGPIPVVNNPNIPLKETKTVLIVILLVALSTSFHSQGVMSAGATGRVIREGSVLSKDLIKILGNIEVFGPVVFAQACIVVSDAINNDPSSVNHVHSNGIADTLLRTLTRWDVTSFYPEKVLPTSAELMMAIPGVLNGLSLTTSHAEKVARFEPMKYLMDMFALPCYAREDVDCFDGSVPLIVGTGIFEMIRHVSSFQNPAIQATVDAMKKILRFGEEILQRSAAMDEKSDDSVNYGIMVRMTTRISEALEPILSKAEHAVYFADHGGVEALLKLYQFVLPSTTSFLSSALSPQKPGSDGRSPLSHQPAAQAVTLALRSYATQQPSNMLSAIVKQLQLQLDALHVARANLESDRKSNADAVAAEGVLCSLPDIKLTELLGNGKLTSTTDSKASDADANKLGLVGEFLRVLATLEWLAALLTWTMHTAQGHLQSRRWFSEFSSKSTQEVLSRLFAVDRSVQKERAIIASLHRKKHDGSEEESAEHAKKSSSGLWKVGSLLLLRFSIVIRSLLSGYSKCVLSGSAQHRRGEESASQLAPHAFAMAKVLAGVFQHHLGYTNVGSPMDAFAHQYYLTFLLETIIQVVLDGTRQQPNTILLRELMRTPSPTNSDENMLTSVFDILGRFLSCSVGQDTAPVGTKLKITSFKIAAGALRSLADLQALANSTHSTAMFAHDSSVDNEQFNCRKLMVELHRLNMRAVLPLWQNPLFLGLQGEKYALEVLPIVVTILKNRLAMSDADKESGGGFDVEFSSGRRGVSYRGRASSGDMDDPMSLRRALFGGRGDRGGASFVVDPNIVESLSAMGFAPARVEHALRRIQVNDVELAMEWILSHPESEAEETIEGTIGAGEDGGDDGDAGRGSEQAGNATDEQSTDEELGELYDQLRSSFESVCFSLIKAQSNVQTKPSSAGKVIPCQQLVRQTAEYMALLCSTEEREEVVPRINQGILSCFEGSTCDDKYVASLAHLLALLVRLDPTCKAQIMKQQPCCVVKLVDFVSSTLKSNADDATLSAAPVLLVIDVLVEDEQVDKRPQSEHSGEGSKSHSKLPFMSDSQLVELCIAFMSQKSLDKDTAHALWQVLRRLTLDYELASLFFSRGGIDLLLNIDEATAFPAYRELTCAILSQTMESPEVLEHLMEEKITSAITKLSTRVGSPSQMRITPRALLMEVTPFASRNEEIFLKALHKSVEIKRSESGRTYIIPRKDSNEERNAAGHGDNSSQDAESREKKSACHKFPKAHRQHAQVLVQKLTEKVSALWQVEKKLTQAQDFKRCDNEPASKPILCVGTYMQFLVHLVSLFPVCATVLAKAKDGVSQENFLLMVLRDFLPSKELCQFASTRKTLRDSNMLGAGVGGDNDSTLQYAVPVLSPHTRERIQSSHRLLVSVGSHSGEGSKSIIFELVRLLQEWPAQFGGGDGDMEVSDPAALSALHAWCALMMSILWPKGSSKGFAWDKVVLGGGVQDRHSFVTLLSEALRKVNLAHPLAHATCTMLLRPLATLTRSFVTRKVKRLLRKRAGQAAAGTFGTGDSAQSNAQASNAVTVPTANVELSGAIAAEEIQVSSDADVPATVGANDVHGDVTMGSPRSASGHELRGHGDDSDDESDRSSVSDSSTVSRDDIGGDEEEEDEDDEEDEDEEDEDDDDEGDEEDEEEDRLRVRSLRRGVANMTSRRQNRLWGALDSELSVLDALDEVDEEEFSYLSILDDESLYADERARRARTLERQSAGTGDANEQPGNEAVVRSVLESISAEGGELDTSTSMVDIDEDDAESSDEDAAGALPQAHTHVSVLSSRPRSRGGDRAGGFSLLEFLEELPDADEDVLFNSFEGTGAARLRSARSQIGRGRLGDASSTLTHPLLRSAASDVDNLQGRSRARMSLPRQSSLLRELEELTEHVQTQLPFSFQGRHRITRDQFSGRGRNRPPTRTRSPFLSNLLSEFSLDIPTSQLSFNRSRSHRLGLRRERDAFDGGRGFGDTSDTGVNLWSEGGRGTDVRSLAARLEQRINALYVNDEPGTPTSPSVEDRLLGSAPSVSSNMANTAPGAEDGQMESTDQPAHLVEEGAAEAASDITAQEADVEATVNDASETASVIALASTLGESSLQSPEHEVLGSDNDMPTQQMQATIATETGGDQQQEPENVPVLPPPAPVQAGDQLLNFTLDLSDFRPPPAADSPRAQPTSTRSVEEESKTEDVPRESTPAPQPTSSAGFLCPEGVDPEVFNSLPPEMQAEIASQATPAVTPAATGGSESFSQMDLDLANTSFDRETLDALPPDIRAEVLANERREREAAAAAAAAPADISRAEEMDNASFVASLAPELRDEILITCDDAFLQTLPSLVRAEAMVLRERAAFRSTYREREPEERNTRDTHDANDMFRRPTLRRMLTSHGAELLGGTRRTSRHGHGDGTSRRGSRRGGDEEATGRHGMIRVDADETETENERIVDDRCVRGMIRLLFMAQSVIQNRVFQRVLSNICLYPLTRQCVRTNMLRVMTLPLDHALVPATVDPNETNFPPEGLFGCAGSDNRDCSREKCVPADVVNRMLHVLVSLVKYNSRFSVEMLRPHGMNRAVVSVKDTEAMEVDSDPNESGVAVLIELLAVPVISRNSTNLDTLLELIELILTPLDRLKSLEEDMKEESEQKTATDDADWLKVPQVELSASRMEEIVRVLCMDICSPQMQERTVSILKLLDRVPDNRKILLRALVHHARELSRPDKYKTSFVGKYETSAVLRSAQDELKLLRLLHTLSDLCTDATEFSECCGEIGLDPFWDALSASLTEARAKGGIEEPEVLNTESNHPLLSVAEDDAVDGMVIEGKSAGASCAMAALLARFLPLVEAFFVVNARDAASMTLSVPDTGEHEESVVNALREGGFASAETALLDAEEKQSDDPNTRKSSLKRMSSTVSEGSGEVMRLANFVEANRVLLNILVREKPSLLDSSLAALVKMPRCRAYLDFDNKRTFFQSAMKKLRQTALRNHGGSSSVRIPVRREHIFEDSFYALRMRSGSELRRKLHISFTGEEGIDAGGVTREWYMILAREIFNPNYVLFTSAADSPTFQPNPLSYVNKDHLFYFEFVGKVIGKAVADGQLLDAHFTRSFYKHILQLPISYLDMEAIDPEYYRNLHSILDNPIEELGLELTFSAEQSNFGKMEIVDLIPNGRNVAVTDENKMEYVKLVTHHRMATGIRQQIDAFLKGFHQLVPPELIAIFNENELELLISGMPEIDIDDLKANAEYVNYKPTDNVIRWFWNVLYSITHEERALFLQFVTGTSKVPLEGFKALEGMRGTQKFNIHKAFGNCDALPSAHTCFNQLDLPEYESEEKLRQRLLFAIREGSEGFGFG
ncbi:TPA: hypothetical protein N0F65_007731 [Lagenidium giganteum]|uniref:Threonine dehydratase n=1 Tax=Lagenidium giganteum TaxID=4803 RepID=A0AAV2Z4C7_9STRA|nr:TPA: hypothetical protein N0F65_007731 [Lagenidium giganteum]